MEPIHYILQMEKHPLFGYTCYGLKANSENP